MALVGTLCTGQLASAAALKAELGLASCLAGLWAGQGTSLSNVQSKVNPGVRSPADPVLLSSPAQPQTCTQSFLDANVQQGECIGLLPFLYGTSTDNVGRTLEEMKAMDFDAMERVHNYIQWMFPIDEASKFNCEAPVLTLDLQNQCLGDPVLQAVLRSNLARFCEFLGLHMHADDGSVAFVEAPYFFDRWSDCWSSKRGRNHNWLRISRVLRCLGLFGLVEEQQAFHGCLEKLYKEGVPCESAIRFWREHAQTRPARVVADQCICA